MLEAYPSVIQQFDDDSCVRKLLFAPFAEAALRINTFIDVWDSMRSEIEEKGIVKNYDRDHLLLSYLLSLGRMLREKHAAQHGATPDGTSEDLLRESFMSVDKGLDESAISSLRAGNRPTIFGQRQIVETVFYEVLKLAMHIPVNHGEAAGLIRCWSYIPESGGLEQQAMVHHGYQLCRMLSNTTVPLSWTGASEGANKDDSKYASTPASVGVQQSDMELMEALWRSGMPIYNQSPFGLDISCVLQTHDHISF